MRKLLFLCLLPFVACQKDADNEDKSDEPLIPLKVGNYWYYENRVFDENGNHISNEEDQKDIVFGPGTKPGYFAIDEDGTEQWYSTATDLKAYYADEDKEYWYFHKSDHIDTFNVFFNEDNYKVVSIAYPGEYQVQNRSCLKNEHVSFKPNGEFDIKDVVYIAPGFGLVRMDTYGLNDYGADTLLDMRLELVDYHVQ